MTQPMKTPTAPPNRTNNTTFTSPSDNTNNAFLPGAGSTGGTTPTQGAPTTASDLLKQTLISWGLGSLLPHLQDYLVKGYDSNTINLYLKDTNEWKTRFAGNELRKAKGLSELAPAQYIATEEQYRSVMQAYGLPSGFYDSHDDFNKFIGNDLSPSELQTRAQVAHDQYINAPDEFKSMWNQYFGPGDAIASILDPDKATSLIQDRANQVAIGGTAKGYGFNVDQQRAQMFAQHGTTLADAQKAYQFLGQNYNTDQSIAGRFNTQFGQKEEENALLLGDGQANATRQNLYNSEEGLFKQKASQNADSLSTNQLY